jgi:hypothetical protein
VESAGGVLSVNGTPALDARALTHVVADGWGALVARAPSLAALHSGRFAAFALPNTVPMFVTVGWLNGSLGSGRRLAEAAFAFAVDTGADAGILQGQKRRRVLPIPAPAHSQDRPHVAASGFRTRSNQFEFSGILGSCGGAEESDVDDYEVKEEHRRDAEDHSAAVVTQVSFKQGEFTRDHEWMLELEDMVEQGVQPPNLNTVVKLMQMAKICDVAMDECNPTRDKYRAKALKLAALKVKGHSKLLESEEEVRELLAPVRGVGPKTTSKVVELVKTGTLRRLDDRMSDPKTVAVRPFIALT